MQCDVTSSAEVDAAFTAVEQLYGPVEVLVANAGVTRDGLILRMSEDDFTSVIDANLAGAFRVARGPPRACCGPARAASSSSRRSSGCSARPGR